MTYRPAGQLFPTFNRGAVLALPIIGTLDSGRAQTIMENLLDKIVETGAEVAILDITGVPTVDTLTAQHLLKTVTAARLIGAECIISGIRPQIAQTIVQLGIDLGNVITKASLSDAFREALALTGLAIGRRPSPPPGHSTARSGYLTGER
jgi:rsbT co-antagonist protein RsbR